MHVKYHVELAELKRWARAEKDVRLAKRMQMVVLAIEGFTAPAIAMSLGSSRRSCQYWVQQFNERGLEGLLDKPGRGKPPLLTPEEQERLKERIAGGPMPEDGVCTFRGKDIQRILEAEFGKVRTLNTVYYLLHQMGYSSLMPRPRHRKADPEAQEAFQRELPEMINKVARNHPKKRLRIYFQDESRFGQQGTLTRVWAPTGSRPAAVRQTQYDYLWVIGAVCPETGQAEGLLSPRLDTEIINIFLKQFSSTLADDEQAVMIWDGAGFHRAGHLEVPENVSLIALPPYSPELNPIENLWHYLKSHHWSNRIHEDYNYLLDAAQSAWKKVCLVPEMIQTICHAPYAESAEFN